jgi:ankyrin repeat protein
MSFLNTRKKYLPQAKRALWYGSMLFSVILLINARHDFRVRRNVDTYIAALQKGDTDAAMANFQYENETPMDTEYLKKRLQEPMTPQMVQHGLDSAASPNDYYQYANYYHYNVFDSPSRMYRLSYNVPNDIFIAQKFLDKGAKPSKQTLQFALERHQLKMVFYCLKNGVKGDWAGSYYPINTICERLKNGYLSKDAILAKSCIDILVKSKVNLNATPNGETPLESIISSPRMEENAVVYRSIIQSLIQGGADVNKKNNNRYVLQTAVENRDVDTVKILLEAGARPNFLLTEWYPDGKDRGYGGETYTLKDKITLLSKTEERCQKSDGENLQKDQAILALLKKYGAKKTL